MAKNISLLGADYPDVPAVVLPKTGGGSAMFVDADDVNNVENALAIVIDGDTAPKAITAGQYLFIKNHSTLVTGGYHATENIASGGTVSDSNVAADTDGISNALRSNFMTGSIGTTSNLSAFQSKIDELLSVAGFATWSITNSNASNIGLASAAHMGIALKNGSNSIIVAFRLNGSEIKIISKSSGTWADSWKSYTGT